MRTNWKQTTLNWGKLLGYQTARGTIMVQDSSSTSSPPSRVAIYTRVSSSENRSNLDSQAERLVAYCEARGYSIHKIVKEVGPGVHDNRPKLLSLLADTSISLLVIEHQDRRTRCGFRYIETLLSAQGRSLEVVNQAEIWNRRPSCRSNSHYVQFLCPSVWVTTGKTQDRTHYPGVA